DRCAKMPGLKALFEELANDALIYDDLEALELLVDLYRKRVPNDPIEDYFRCRVLIKKKQIQEAIPLFKNAISRIQDEESAKKYSHGFLYAMRSVNQLLDAYSAVPDAKLAFRHLAGSLAPSFRAKPKKEDKATLRKLIDRHRERDPNNPWID